ACRLLSAGPLRCAARGDCKPRCFDPTWLSRWRAETNGYDRAADTSGGDIARRRHRLHDALARRRPGRGRCRARPTGTSGPGGAHRDRRARPARESLRGQRGVKLARVACAGAIHAAQPQQLSDGRAGVRLTDGRTLAEDEVVWLPPLEAGTILALGLNYAARAKELAFGKEEEPLVFLKGPGTLLGHRGVTRR